MTTLRLGGPARARRGRDVANLRLLSAALALAATMLPALAACGGSRRVEVPRLAGQILDKRTGKPIEGMAVYQFYETFDRMASVHEGTGSRDFRWTMTDADGRFEFPAHVVAEALKDHVKIDPESPRVCRRPRAGDQ